MTPSVECGVGEGPSLQTYFPVMLEKYQILHQQLGRTAVQRVLGRQEAGWEHPLTCKDSLGTVTPANSACYRGVKAKVRFSERSHTKGQRDLLCCFLTSGSES